jgi:hypothetical protein
MYHRDWPTTYRLMRKKKSLLSLLFEFIGDSKPFFGGNLYDNVVLALLYENINKE